MIVQCGGVGLFLLRTGIDSSAPFDTCVIGKLVVLAFQMDVRLHGRDDAFVSQPLLNEFPIYWLAGAQIGDGG